MSERRGRRQLPAAAVESRRARVLVGTSIRLGALLARVQANGPNNAGAEMTAIEAVDGSSTGT
jgi:hypothetical protein